MKLLCEMMVEEILPSVRALVAKDLMQTYGMNQEQVSKKLGVTQPAISQYVRELRGQKIGTIKSNGKMMLLVKDISKRIADGKLDIVEAGAFCIICRRMREDGGEFNKISKLLKCKG